jgi:ATP-dependent helicase HrpB
MLEPRRLAARTIATRMSFLLGEEVGKSVGFRIRFENCASPSTRIEVLTEGILTRMLLSDNSLEGVGMVIFDEFHERNIYADTALALCREAQQVLRPDLRIMIMSATLNMPHLTSLLNAPVVESNGRQYPVDIIYTGDRDVMVLPELTTRIIGKAVKENDGDILVFLPGEAEIRKCEEILTAKFRDIAIHPLYGMLPFSKQTSAIMPNRNGKRKIVLATSIAETSLTIEGIKVVVDTGFGRTMRFDPKSGLSRLETIEISKDSADQRAGRAGRLGPDKCYRMWTKATNERMQEHRIPEILEADLAPLVLDMAQWGIVDIRQLTWLDPPPKANLEQASQTLHMLDALENGRITEQGKKMHELPCHPRIAHMLLMAKEYQHSLAHATDIAAILEERDPLPKDSGIDINLRIEALRKQRAEKRLIRSMERIEKIASSYRSILGIEEENTPIDPYETGVLLVFAYPERIAHSRPGNNAQFQLANGNYAMAGHKDDLANEQWLAVSHVDARDGMGKIFMASPLNPRDLAPLVKESETITWDLRKGGLVATKDLRIGSIVLQSKPLPTPDPKHLIQAISDAIKKEGANLLDFNEEVEQWQNRVLSLRKWRPQENWPDVSTHTLLITNIEWLGPALSNIRKPEDLKKIELLPLLEQLLNSAPQGTEYGARSTEFLLNKLAPQRITVPSGSNIKIKYFANGDSPVLAVRLQEVFGMAETPRINEGKTALLIHLLSPGYKPVQVTADLHSFWNNAYYEVKKELKIKYPKHAWPEDPWSAKAIRK